MSTNSTIYQADLIDELLAMKERLSSLERRETVPIGSILAWGGGAAPLGFLICDGAKYKRVRTSSTPGYPELFAVIGTAHNTDIDTPDTEFQVPDYRGVFLLGLDPTNPVVGASRIGGRGGAAEHTLIEEEMPAHVHPPDPSMTDYWQANPGAGNVVAGGATYAGNNAIDSTGSAGGDQPHNNMPPFAVVRYIIAAL